MDSLDRRTRGAAHGPDHAVMGRLWRLRVSDSTTGSGYAYVTDEGQVQLLAASNRRTAERLLWDALAATSGETVLPHVTAGQPVGGRRRPHRPARPPPGGLPGPARPRAAARRTSTTGCSSDPA